MAIIRGVCATLLIAGLILAAEVQAAQPGSNPIGPAKSMYYVGAKGGLMMPDHDGFDNAINIGAYGGYNLLGAGAPIKVDLGGGTLAIEGEATLTASKGDFSVGGVSGDWKVTTLGAYAAYRFPVTSTFFAKGKAGLVRSDVGISVSGVSGNGSETDFSIGAGVGFVLGSGSLEVEITRIKAKDDFDFLSVGYLWNF
jgi:hypothetical protein